MRGAILLAPGRVGIVDLPCPVPGPGQIRVRLEGCGVCASNLGPWSGPDWVRFPTEPGALGHEAWGRIEALGDGVTGFAIGDRVATLGQHGYAEQEVVAASAALCLPAALDGAPFPGEPLGCAVNIFRRSAIRAGDTVAVIGAGFLGTILVGLAREAGARVIAVSRRATALGFARDAGAAATVALDEDVVARVADLTDGALCDCVIEAAGKQSTLDLAARLCAVRGRLVVAGYHQDGPRQVDMQLWNWRGLDVINAHERDPAVYLRGMADAAAMAEAGRLDPARLCTHRYPLEALGEALDATRDRPEGFLKAWIGFG